MRTVLRGVIKFFVANLMVIFAIMLLPVFIITDDVPIFNEILNFLFNDKG